MDREEAHRMYQGIDDEKLKFIRDAMELRARELLGKVAVINTELRDRHRSSREDEIQAWENI